MNDEMLNIEIPRSLAARLMDALATAGVTAGSPGTRLPPVLPDGAIVPDWLVALNSEVEKRNPTGYYNLGPGGQVSAWSTPIHLAGSIIWAGTMKRDDITQAQRESIARILNESFALAWSSAGYNRPALYPWGDGEDMTVRFPRIRMVAPTSYDPSFKDPIQTLDDLRRVVEGWYSSFGWL